MLMSVAMSNDINFLTHTVVYEKLKIFGFEWSLIVVVGEFVFEDDR